MSSSTLRPVNTGDGSPGLARRSVLVGATALVVVIAVGVSLFVVLSDSGEDPPPPAKPLEIVAPRSLDDIFTVSGEPAPLPRQDRRLIVRTVRRYLAAATILPLEHDPEDEESSPPPPLERFFTKAAGARLETDDRFALADRHLPRAEFGVSTERAELGLSGLIDDGRGPQLVAAAVDVQMVVRLEDDTIVVNRTGNLVLEPVGDSWRIGAYNLRVERSLGSETTTTEAAFG